MKALLLRSGSITAQLPVVPASPRVSLSRHDSFAGDRAATGSPTISLHLEISRRNGAHARGIRRALSETDVIASHSRIGSMSPPAKVPDDLFLSEAKREEAGCLTLRRGFDEMWPKGGGPMDEVGFCGGGSGKGRKLGGDGGDDAGDGGFGGNSRRIGDYYRQMLTSNPGDPLLLRNYGKYLHEVEGDLTGAEEYYGRAILASPGDGDVLSLYGKLIWETQRDEERAQSYFDQAVRASPDDCTVLGSYAHFMWEAEEDEEDGLDAAEASPAAMVAAF